MCGRDCAADRICERDVDAPRVGEMIERPGLVEAAHLDRPFDRLALAANREPPIGFSRDRNDTAIELGRIGAIDGDLGLAGGLALVERGKVEKRKLYRTFELEGALAGEEHHARVGVDALDRRSAVGRGLREKREHQLLGRGEDGHPNYLSLVGRVSGPSVSRYDLDIDPRVTRRTHISGQMCRVTRGPTLES